MNIRQAMQAGPVKAIELFGKLSDTSNGAVKTRDKLFSDLKDELELLVDLEERHLLPLLGKHKETKDLVAEAIKGNKEMRARLQELDGIPKHEDAFLQKLAELQKGFQQHVRDGKKELLPAVQKVLSEEEAAGLAQGIEAGHAEAEQVKRDEAERTRAEAREGREKAERQAATAEQAKRDEAERARAIAREDGERAKREAAVQDAAREARATTERAARQTAREATKVAERTADAARTVTHRAVEGMTEGARRAGESLQDTASAYRDGARTAILDGQAAATSSVTASKAATSAMVEMQAEGRAWMSRAITVGMNASGELMRCTTPRQVVGVQRDFMSAAMRNWMESSSRILQISQRVAGEALPALWARRDAGPQDDASRR